MSLPNWKAGVRVARAVAGIKTGETTVEDAMRAVEDASNRRDWAGSESAFDAWVANGFDIQPDSATPEGR